MHGAIGAGFFLIALVMVVAGIALTIALGLENKVNPPAKNNYYDETTQTYDDGEVVRAWVKVK